MAGPMDYNSTVSSGLTWTASPSPAPSAVPKGLIATRAVELRDGWTGQLIVADEVVREKGGFDTAAQAEEWATLRVVKAIKHLLTA